MKADSSLTNKGVCSISTEQFKDKVVIVTGGGSGIGQALCQELGQIGSTVVVAVISMTIMPNRGVCHHAKRRTGPRYARRRFQRGRRQTAHQQDGCRIRA